MKLSIWQQFSSNHSGFFWVVGAFQTLEQAENAFHKLRDILFAIDAWHRQNPKAIETAFSTGSLELFPPEKAVGEQYQVAFPMSIDWTNWANYYLEGHPSYQGLNARLAAENLIDSAVQLVGHNVIVHAPDQTWMSTQPFEALLKVFGAETTGYDLESLESEAGPLFELHNQLRFTAPDIQTADRLETSLKTYLSRGLASADNPPPWYRDTENFQQVLATSKLLKREYIDLAQRVWDQKLRLHTFPSPSPYGLKLPQERLALRDVNVQIVRTEEQFVINDLWFYWETLGVPALIAWLEVNQCTDISFRYLRTLNERADST